MLAEKSALCVINFVDATALAFCPFPPVIETTGVPTRSNPGSIILISVRFPVTARKPVAPIPISSLIPKFGGLIISNPIPGEITLISFNFPYWIKSFDL